MAFPLTRVESKAATIQTTFQDEMEESRRHFQQKLEQTESELASWKAEVAEKSRTLADVNTELATSKAEIEVISKKKLLICLLIHLPAFCDVNYIYNFANNQAMKSTEIPSLQARAASLETQLEDQTKKQQAAILEIVEVS